MIKPLVFNTLDTDVNYEVLAYSQGWRYQIIKRFPSSPWNLNIYREGEKNATSHRTYGSQQAAIDAANEHRDRQG